MRAPIILGLLVPLQVAAQGLGPADPDAMAALDSQVAGLRAAIDMDQELDSEPNALALIGDDFEPAAPFICHLPDLLNNLNQSVESASELTQQRWQEAIDTYDIEALPRQSLTERCALYQTLSTLLTHALEAEKNCDPTNSAQRLLALVGQLPPARQPEFVPLLAALTQAHREAADAQTPIDDLCPDYNRVEHLMRQAIGS